MPSALLRKVKQRCIAFLKCVAPDDRTFQDKEVLHLQRILPYVKTLPEGQAILWIANLREGIHSHQPCAGLLASYLIQLPNLRKVKPR